MKDELFRKIEAFCRDEGMFAPGDSLLLGLSGGADSVFLLYFLRWLSARLSLKLHCVHVEHGIRGEEGLRDADFCRRLCSGLSVDFRLVQVQAPEFAAGHRLGLEEAARLLRYEAFAQVQAELDSALAADNMPVLDSAPAASSGACRLVVAHHADDQAETVLHQLCRGSGLRGLAGMPPVRGGLCRPLLGVRRSEIERWLAAAGIDYVTDSSNADTTYTRNYLRSLVLPKLEGMNRRAVAHIGRTARLAAEADDYFSALAEELLAGLFPAGSEADTALRPEAPYRPAYPADIAKDGMTAPAGLSAAYSAAVLGRKYARLPLSVFRGQPPIVQRYLLTAVLRRMGLPLKDWSLVHLDDLTALIGRSAGGHLDLPYRLCADKRGKYIELRVYDTAQSVQRREEKKNGR